MSEYIVKVYGQMPDAIYERAIEEIVRCRDCKYLNAHGTACAFWDYCDIENIDGFCAWGKRETNNKTGDFVTHDAHADDYKQAAEYWQRMYEQTFAERMCHIEHPYYGDAPVINSQPRCSECKTEFAVGTFPNYCPNCGAHVIKSDQDL